MFVRTNEQNHIEFVRTNEQNRDDFVICMDKICPDKQQIDGEFVVFIRTNGNRRKTLILCLLVQITKNDRFVHLLGQITNRVLDLLFVST